MALYMLSCSARSSEVFWSVSCALPSAPRPASLAIWDISWAFWQIILTWLLGARHGALCLFVPARPEIYAPMDKDFGHFRRYTRPELRRKLTQAGFEMVRLDYFNCVGYFAWWLNFCVLKKRCFEPAKLRFYDRVIFPVVRTLEARIMRPPFGQSLLAVARSQASAPGPRPG